MSETDNTANISTGTTDWDYLKKILEENRQLQSASASVCPSCGYCPHCGRGGYRTYPYYPYDPWYPSYPFWSSPSITISGGGTYQPNSTTTWNANDQITYTNHEVR